MRKHCFSHNLWYYSTLTFIFILGALVFFQTTDKKLQISIVVITSFLYVIWGIIHHRLHHSLSAKIVIEYSLIGSLGMSLIFFLMQGSLL